VRLFSKKKIKGKVNKNGKFIKGKKGARYNMQKEASDN